MSSKKYSNLKDRHSLYNIFDHGIARNFDEFPIIAVANDGILPFFILKESSLGFLLKMQFINGRSWGEEERTNFLQKLERALRIDSQFSTINYTYSFTAIRKPIKRNDLEKYKVEKKCINNVRAV